MENLAIIKSKFLRNKFDQNTYVLSNKNEAVIIDAGAELEDVKAEVGNKKVLAVLMTHLHFDHIWNLEKYIEEFGCDVFVVQGYENKLENSALNCSTIVRIEVTKNIDKNKIKYYTNKLKIGKFSFDVFFTPGHSADSVCILFKDYLFSGDTVFADGIGRTDLYDSDNKQMAESLKLVRSLKYKTLYSGHYESQTKENIDWLIDRYI